MRFIDAAERRARLARRHHLAPGRRAPDAVAAARRLVGLHATSPATVYLSARARVDDLAAADVTGALYDDRTLVKHLAMRRTLWVIPADTFGDVRDVAGGRVAASERARLIKDVEGSGLVADGAAWLEAAGEAVMAHLAENGEATSAQLRAALPLLEGSTTYAPHKSWGGQVPVAPRVLTVLSAEGRIVRGTNDGGWHVSRPRWTTTAAWLGAEPAPGPPHDALVRLVRRWLFAFGPATVADLRWWLGGTLTATRAALAAVGAVEVETDAGAAVVLPDDVDPVEPVAPWAALLPELDPSTMGWAARDWYLGPHRERIFDSAGNGGPTAWWDGRIVGGWRQDGPGEVALQLLEDVGADARAALEAEAERLAGWLAAVKTVLRFPSPLSKEAPAGDAA
ncbi:MAG: winged helix DNA-binding domain-containing protein [Thermoleophilia bacterium]